MVVKIITIGYIDIIHEKLRINYFLWLSFFFKFIWPGSSYICTTAAWITSLSTSRV